MNTNDNKIIIKIINYAFSQDLSAGGDRFIFIYYQCHRLLEKPEGEGEGEMVRVIRRWGVKG